MAERALEGVGDPSLGEWRERGIKACHIRRRLSDAERDALGGLGVTDVRGTVEERRRIAAVLRDAPHLRGVVRIP